MEVKELRVGNYIEYNGMTKKVFSIDRNNFITFETDETVIGKYKYEQSPSLHLRNFNPIPLTEEWLLKFGFEKNCNETLLIKPLSGESTFIVINQTLNYWVEYSDAHGHVESVGMPQLNYVHQLQNLYFALTGEELTLKD